MMCIFLKPIMICMYTKPRNVVCTRTAHL